MLWVVQAVNNIKCLRISASVHSSILEGLLIIVTSVACYAMTQNFESYHTCITIFHLGLKFIYTLNDMSFELSISAKTSVFFSDQPILY